MSKSPDAIPRKETEKPSWNPYPIWAPRFWHGMLLGGWLRLVASRCHRIHPLRLPMALMVTLATALNSAVCFLQHLLLGRAVARAKISQPPIFIVGHWRSGTTYLHELLVLDKRFAYPTTYECFAANHFLITRSLFPRLLGVLLPAKRPTDNMAVSFSHPQEDEFALVSMGAPSPMLMLAFPNDPPPCMEFVDMEGVVESDLRRWRDAIVRFVRMQTYLKGKPLVLKSPPHTGRIQVLAELFPGAKFIHIVRDPVSVFCSTRRLWIALSQFQGLQIPRHENLDEFVFTTFQRMYRGFERQREGLDPARICDVRYEELVKDPVGVIAGIYEQLELGEYESVRASVEAYAGERKGYQPTRHELDPDIKAEIRRRWADYIERYGYAETTAVK